MESIYNDDFLLGNNSHIIERAVQKELNKIFKGSKYDFDKIYVDIELPIEEMIMLEFYENIETAVVSKFPLEIEWTII